MGWIDDLNKARGDGFLIIMSSETGNIVGDGETVDRLLAIVVGAENSGLCWPTQFSSVPCCPLCGGRKELLGGHNYDTFRYSPVMHKPTCPYSEEYKG